MALQDLPGGGSGRQEQLRVMPLQQCEQRHRAPVRIALLQCHERPLDFYRRLVRAALRPSRAILQPGQPFVAVASPERMAGLPTDPEPLA